MDTFLGFIANSNIYRGLTHLTSSLWSEPLGQIFLVTTFFYTIAYLIYGGYMARFMGGYSLFPFGLSGLTVSDLLFLFPTALLTLVSIVFRAPGIIFRETLRIIWLLLKFFVLPTFGVAIISLLLTRLWQMPALVAGYLLPMGQLILVIGAVWLLFALNVSHEKQRYRYYALILFTCGMLITQLSGLSLNEQTVPNISANPVIGVIIHLMWDFLVILLVVIILMLFVAFGVTMAEISIREGLLSKVSQLVVNQPLPILGHPDIASELPRQATSLKQSWWFKTSVPVRVEPDVFTYTQKNELYLIASFHDSVAFYAPNENKETINGRTILVARNLISAMDLQLSSKRLLEK